MVTLPGATCTGQDVAQRLTSDGYVIVSGLMSERDVAAARADLARILAATPAGRNEFEGFDTQRVYALFAKTRTFDRLAVHPLLLDGARPGARALSAQRPGGHPHRARGERPDAAPGRRDLPAAGAAPAGRGQHHVAAR